MAERFDYQAGSNSVPAIPYDTFEAANLFLATGRSLEEVLPRIDLTTAQWERLCEVYKWFPTSYGETERRGYFAGLDDTDILRRVMPPRWSLKPDDTPKHNRRSKTRRCRRSNSLGQTTMSPDPISSGWSEIFD